MLDARTLRTLRELGLETRPSPPVALDSVRLSPPALDSATLAELAQIVGEGAVLCDRAERIAHAAGRGYPDLVRLRSGQLQEAPDAVVVPPYHRQLSGV
jgi:alkyldihydroxyacetonephosphate synthase